MILSIKRFGFDVSQKITLLLLFLAGVNIYNKYYYFCFAAVAIFIVAKKKMILDWNVLFLLVFSVSWLILSPDSNNVSLTTFIKPFLYPAAYIVGRNFFAKSQNDYVSNKRDLLVVPVLVVLALGPFTHYLLNYFNGLGSFSRNTIDIWSGTVLSATSQAALACIMIGVAVAALFVQNKPSVKIFAALAIILTFLYNLILAGRTLFLILIIVSLVCSIYYIKESNSISKGFRLFIFILAAIFILSIAYSYNLFGFKNYIVNSNIYFRFFNNTSEDILSSQRGNLKLIHLNNFEKGLFGGCQIRYLCGSYAHDLWLDAYDEAGIFALIALVFFCVGCLYTLWKCISLKYITRPLRFMLLAIYTAIFLQFFVEPIIQGMPWLFVCFCFIHGIVVQRQFEAKNELVSKS